MPSSPSTTSRSSWRRSAPRRRRCVLDATGDRPRRSAALLAEALYRFETEGFLAAGADVNIRRARGTGTGRRARRRRRLRPAGLGRAADAGIASDLLAEVKAVTYHRSGEVQPDMRAGRPRVLRWTSGARPCSSTCERRRDGRAFGAASDECLWELPATGGHAGARAGLRRRRAHAEPCEQDQSLAQVRNVAHLPGILRYSLAMPDIHFGYGFPIGGVAAFSVDDGVVSPGGVGYDINCGVPPLATDLTGERRRGQARSRWWTSSSGTCPRGWARRAPSPSCRARAGEAAGARAPPGRWSTATARAADLDHTEDGGALPGADPARRQRAGLHARPRPGGHPRLRQPLPRDPGGGRGLRPRGRARLRPVPGPGHR